MQDEAARSLAAVVIADIAGYSELMGRNERVTHKRVREIERELVAPTVAAHRGRIVKTMGDGFLAVFNSPVEAVRCALVIQHSMVVRNLDEVRQDWIRYRIGINLGDIIVDNDDVFGEGVNIAARLEQLAEPGSVYISGGIYEQIKSKLAAGYQSLGQRKVKHISEPVSVYRVLPDPAAANQAPRRRRFPQIAIAKVSRWSLTFLGMVLLALLVWWFGPFLSILEGRTIRIVLIAAMLLAWVGGNLLPDLHRRETDARLLAGVAGAEPDQAEAETAAMREKLLSALTLLKQASGSRGYLYEQPWYAIIGPPGTGKTTALLNAELSFPLALEMGQKVAGFGGTRMCDWWFTDTAVLIDTAGRYTTQEDTAVDKAGWSAFLSLLRQTRSRQPLNGLIVAFALQDAAQPGSSIGASSPEQRSVHAAAIRRRINEVYEQLGVRVPVYMLFTKVDLVEGFIDFFGDLDREQLGQVWGMTFPLADSAKSPTMEFSDEFELLIQRLNERLLDRLQAERGSDRRALIAAFAAQMSSLKAPLAGFINEAFGASRPDAEPLLRGVYFTSGTQEGTPIDRLTATMARSFGIDQMRSASLTPQQGRSFFLTRLLRDVVFQEAMLVSLDRAAMRRKALLRIGMAAVALVVVVAGAGALLQTRSASSDAIVRADAALAAYTRAAQAFQLDPVEDSDLPRILPLLDQARALPFGAEGTRQPPHWFPGLSQNAKLASGAQILYRHAVENLLLPRLIQRLEGQMRQNFNQPAYLYEATRVYLELGSLGPLDRGLIKEWMHDDWQTTWRGPAAADMRDRLEGHLAALLDERLPKVLLDGGLIEDARRTFSRVSLADRVYGAIRHSAQAAALTPWRVGDSAGTSGVHMFHRRSGLLMTEGVPGFFTVDGFYKVLLPQLPVATNQAASESWVLGRQAEVDPSSPQALGLQSDVVALYSTEYAKTWDSFLADIDVEPLGNMQQALQSLYVLSSPRSPLRDLLTGIIRQLTLTVPPDGGAGVPSEMASRVREIFGMTPRSADVPGKAVETHYAPLISYLGKGPGAPIDTLLTLIDNLQQQLARLGNSPPGTAAPVGADDPVLALAAEATRAPDPVRRWIQVLSSSGSALRSAGARRGAAEAFNTPGGPASLCRQVVTGRYPFSGSSPSDSTLDDFARLFAANGLLDHFFTTQLRSFVDTSGPIWRVQSVAGVASPVSPSDLLQFQRAATIRELFFHGGGNQPMVRFDIRPVSADKGAKQVTLDLDGTSLVLTHGSSRGMSVTWPGTNRTGSTRLLFDPPPSNGPPALQASGPWALFRLFSRGNFQQIGGGDQYKLTFNVDDRQVVYEIRAESANNPFISSVLRDFRCPVM